MGEWQDTRERVKRKIQQANAIRWTMGLDGYGNLSVNTLAENMSKKVTELKGSKFGFGKARSIKKMKELESVLDKYINSEWVTPEGRERIYQREVATFQKGGKKQLFTRLSKSQAIKAISVFESEVVQRALEAGYITSPTIFDAISEVDDDTNVNVKELEERLKSIDKNMKDDEIAAAMLKAFSWERSD